MAQVARHDKDEANKMHHLVMDDGTGVSVPFADCPEGAGWGAVLGVAQAEGLKFSDPIPDAVRFAEQA